jgi:hypothetical protein
LIADNVGSFFIFPSFILPVDDSSDCIVSSSFSSNHESPDFDSRLVGSISSVSDNTRFHQMHHPVVSSQSRPTTIPKPIKKQAPLNILWCPPGLGQAVSLHSQLPMYWLSIL